MFSDYSFHIDCSGSVIIHLFDMIHSYVICITNRVKTETMNENYWKVVSDSTFTDNNMPTWLR